MRVGQIWDLDDLFGANNLFQDTFRFVGKGCNPLPLNAPEYENITITLTTYHHLNLYLFLVGLELKIENRFE